MINLPSVNMPLELIYFLKKEMSNPRDMADTVDKVLKRNRAMESSVLSAFSEFDSQKRIHNIITSLGHKNFRNRFAGVYLHRFMNGHYPAKTNPEIVSDITKFEDLFFNYQMHSSSRIFLFGLYLVMAELQSEKLGLDSGDIGLIGFPREIINCFKRSTGRVFELDWILLFLWHAQQFWGMSGLERYLSEDNCSYSALYARFNEEQQQNFLSNVLAYGSSIKETEIYFWEKIG